MKIWKVIGNENDWIEMNLIILLKDISKGDELVPNEWDCFEDRFLHHSRVCSTNHIKQQQTKHLSFNQRIKQTN